MNFTTEKALEPDLPICDAHHHIWGFESRRYLAADYVKDASCGHNIEQSVTVQSRGNYEQVTGGGMSPVDETAFVMKQIQGLRTKIDVAAGFVGYADMAIGKAVQAVIEAHIEAAKKRFKGIRYPLQYKPGQSLLSDPNFREGFAFLPKYGLIYELQIGMSQYTELVDLAKKFPNTAMIIDHLGWPRFQAKTSQEKDEMIVEWRRRIQMVAPIDNIYIKLGGTPRYFGFEKKSQPTTSEEIVKVVGPYYQFVIDQLGPKRCMFESNFPTDKQFSSFTVIWNAFKLMTKSYSETERAYIFHDTANQVYNL